MGRAPTSRVGLRATSLVATVAQNGYVDPNAAPAGQRNSHLMWEVIHGPAHRYIGPAHIKAVFMGLTANVMGRAWPGRYNLKFNGPGGVSTSIA